VATILGIALAWGLGWSFGAGLVFGLALSVASTVVPLRALQDRRLVETERGRIAVGMLFDPGRLLREPLPVLAPPVHHRHRQVCRGLPDGAGLPPPDRHCPDDFRQLGQIGEFSFILAARTRPRPDPGRRGAGQQRHALLSYP
jgi:hypothetical protein